MIGFILAAYLIAAPVPKAPTEAVTASSSRPLVDVWLACKWHETWQSSSSLGTAHRDSTSEHDYDKTFVFSPQNGTFSFYDPKDQYLLTENATIGTSTILIDDQDHNETMLGESKSERQWTVSRSDLSIKLFGYSLNNVRMDDGRIATSQILMNGAGACVMTSPKPLAQVAPNKF